jgi:soluble lytic murein transglycosylase-like protein
VSRKQIGAAAISAAAMFAIATPSASAAREVTPEQTSVFTQMAAMTAVSSDSTGTVASEASAETPPEESQNSNASAKTGVDTGPSKWEGRTLNHPEGGKIAPEVTRWANLVSSVMTEQDISDRYLEGILAQIQQESFGNPKATNNWDSNAAAGDPSKGLLQVIGSTYETHAKKGFEHRKYQDVPYTNIYAALTYVQEAYGMSKFMSWNGGANHGY